MLARPLLAQLFAIQGGQGTSCFPELPPSLLRGARPFRIRSRHIQCAAFPLALVGDVEMGTMTAGRIAVTGTGRVSAAAGSFREAALDHAVGGAEEFAKKSLPTHNYMLGLWPLAHSCQAKNAVRALNRHGGTAQIQAENAHFCAGK